MWKFKTSKYKNAAPKVPKKEEWINDISASNLLQSCGNHIAASGAYITFNTDASGGGSSLGIVPLGLKGRRDPGSLKFINAHSEFVTDFNFCPFDDYLLASCSHDGTCNIWQLPEELEDNISSPLASLPRQERKVEVVQWHSTASGILAMGVSEVVKIFDVERSAERYAISQHTDQIQSLCWNGGGSSIVTSCKDKKLRVIDPRTETVAQEVTGHGNNRDSRALWLGDTDYISSVGFSSTREREVILRDVRNFDSVLSRLSFDSSTSVLMPLYDPDTNMMFLCGKGDTSIKYLEISWKEPFLTLNSTDSIEQMKGATLVPKRALDVMSCEVDRIMVLTKRAIIPVPYHVPRKSHTEFHSDLFPETNSGLPALTADVWLAGAEQQVTKISLDPTQKTNKVVSLKSESSSASSSASTQSSIQQPAKVIISNDDSVNEDTNAKANSSEDSSPQGETRPSISSKPVLPTKVQPSPKPTIPQSKPSPTVQPDNNMPNEEPPKPSVVMRVKKSNNVLSGVRQSKFRHLKGTCLHKSTHIDNVRNVSKTMPGESDMFYANKKFCAVPLAGPGGNIAVLKVTSPGRLPDTGVPIISNGSALMDFCFDPFDENRLVTACDDAKIRVWNIPNDGLPETLSQPDGYLKGHTEKIYFIKYHPLAKDILASGSYDMTVRIWDVQSGEQFLELDGHTDTIFCFSWSPDGKYCCTICKDGNIRIYNPRLGPTPIQEGPGPTGTRGARVVWACGGKFLLVSGFNKQSFRVLMIYDPSDLSKCVYEFDITIDPAILIPFYDEDSSTVFLTGRGDSLVLAYEVAEEYPHLFELSSYSAQGLHQALAFLPKSEVDVKDVEFAKAMRLTSNNIEPVSFTVPRVKTEFFQDDIYPDTKVTWEPTMTSEEWLSNMNTQPRTISLRPEAMKLLSEAPVEEKVYKYESFDSYKKTHKTDEQKKEELLSAVTKKLDLRDEPLPQDLTEGVDEDEWSD